MSRLSLDTLRRFTPHLVQTAPPLDQTWLSARELSAWLGVSVQVLASWRLRSVGPAWTSGVPSSHRGRSSRGPQEVVVYARPLVLAWLSAGCPIDQARGRS